MVNTPSGNGSDTDGAHIRRAAVRARIPCLTTIEAAEAAARALLAPAGEAAPLALQDLPAAAGSGAPRASQGFKL